MYKKQKFRNKKLNIAFIGGGSDSSIGMVHYCAVQMDGRANVICGSLSNNSKENIISGKKYNLSNDKIYSDWKELINKEKNNIDVVVVLTPTPSHFQIVKRLIELKVPVICEKPIVSKLSDCLILHKLQKQHKSFVAVIYNYTGYPLVREMKARIENNQIGKLEYLEFEMPQDAFINQYKSYSIQKWRMHDQFIPNICLDLGVHLYNLSSFITNQNPYTVFSEFGEFSTNKIVDHVNILIKYKSGLKGSFWLSKRAAGIRNGLKLRIFGSKGSFEWLQMNPEILKFSDEKGNLFTIDRGSKNLECSKQKYNRFRPGHPSGFIEAFANMYNDIFNSLVLFYQNKPFKNKFVFGTEHSVASLNLFHSVSLSNKKKNWQKLNNKN